MDISTKLRRWSHDAVITSPASDLMDEAAAEIERLQSLVRFHERVIRSGDVAAITEAEREAIACGAELLDDREESMPTVAGKFSAAAVTLRRLLERLDACPICRGRGWVAVKMGREPCARGCR